MQVMGRVTAMPRNAMLVAIAALFAASVSAQQPLAPVRVSVPANVRNNALADTLEMRAEAFTQRERDWRSAARLQRRAAELRGDDPRAAASFRMAAWTYSAAGDLGTGRTMMEKAGQRAAAVGDLEQAAVSYIDAALIASADGNDGALPRLLRKTRLILDAPLFPADRRNGLLDRIEGTPRLAVAWGSVQ